MQANTQKNIEFKTYINIDLKGSCLIYIYKVFIQKNNCNMSVNNNNKESEILGFSRHFLISPYFLVDFKYLCLVCISIYFHEH